MAESGMTWRETTVSLEKFNQNLMIAAGKMEEMQKLIAAHVDRQFLSMLDPEGARRGQEQNEMERSPVWGQF